MGESRSSRRRRGEEMLEGVWAGMRGRTAGRPGSLTRAGADADAHGLETRFERGIRGAGTVRRLSQWIAQ